MQPTVPLTYKLDLGGIDSVAILARTSLEAVSDDWSVRLTLSDGTCFEGELHASLSLDAARTLHARTLDLDAAYEQLLVSRASLWCSVLAIEDPDQVRQMFISHVIPFGASASVYTFNKVARAFHVMCQRLFGLLWCNYYDDFPQIDLAVCGHSSQRTAKRMFDLLGWRYSCKETKRRPGPMLRCFRCDF